jgi:serine/threonine protein kinase/Tfp pilus assembly protein PilF
MTAERWQQVEAIMQSALDIDSSAERIRFVADACAGDAELKHEVERLMIAAVDAESFIELPAWTAGGFLNSNDKNIRDSLDQQIGKGNSSLEQTDDFIARKIGVFELKKELGRGGMGTVYLAERADGEFRQKAAVKLIKRGMDTDFIVKRFRHERQILAALNHPNIARLIDGGTSADGLPYFVMEYVEGKPLYRFCDELKLGTAERLRLFRRICEAVEAAHQLKVVHRDLKPSNILVKTDGTPKLLDFGIAKILDSDLASATLEPTATAMRLMTPEYASPEQVCGEPVTPASDIYSLGVLLYELLTGHRPYRLRNRALHEIHRAVCEEMPSVPSESLTGEDNLVPTADAEEQPTRENTTLEFIFRARSTDFENLRHELKGDLDKIILKTLRKNAAERYQTASELAADITRFLEKRPILAESSGAAKKNLVSKSKANESDFAGKQSAAILPFKIMGASNTKDTDGEEFLGIGLADALVTRLSVIRQIVVRPTSSALAFVETTDPFRAGQELAVDFVVDGNIRRIGQRIRVTVQLLSVGKKATLWAQTFDEKFTDVLALEDSIAERIAKSLLPQLTGEEQIQLQKRGTDSPAAYEAYLRGRFHWNQFTPEALLKARQSFENAIELDPRYALAHVGLADFYVWANVYSLIPSAEANELAEAAARCAIELDNHLGEAYATLGMVRQNQMNWAEAERLYRRGIELNPHYAQTREFYSAQLVGSGRFDKGIEEIKIHERLDPLNLRAKTMVSWTFFQTGRYVEALETAQRFLELDPNYPQAHFQMGLALWANKQPEAALPFFERFDRMIPDFAFAKFQLCHAHIAVNREQEARRVFDDIKNLAVKGYVKPYFLGMAHASFGEADEAFEFFEQARREHDPWMIWFGTDPRLENLRGDARFVDLLEEMNNPIAERFKSRPIRSSKSSASDVKIEQPGNDLKVETDEKSIAVLPLTILGANTGNANDEYLGVGLADAMITRLSKIKRLIVRPTSSILRFSAEFDSFAAGRELEVDYVLDGNLRHVGDRVRVSAQLLKVADKSTVWAEKFDEKFTDVLELEDVVAEKVASRLLPQLTGEERHQLAKRGTDKPAAYEAYLRGRFHWNQFTPDSLLKSIEFFKQAVRLEPEYALAFASMADCHYWLGAFGIGTPLEHFAAARTAAKRAIEYDATLGEAYSVLGFVSLFSAVPFKWREAEDLCQRGLELNPNYAWGHIWYSAFLASAGRFDESIKQVRRAIELDPLSPFNQQHLGWIFYQARRFDEARAQYEKTLAENPDFGFARGTYGWALQGMGRTAESLEHIQRANELNPKTSLALCGLAATVHKLGKTDEATTLVRQIEKDAQERHFSPFHLAVMYSIIGETCRAFEQFEAAITDNDAWVIWLSVDPQLDVLRGDARYQNWLRRTGNPLAQ